MRRYIQFAGLLVALLLSTASCATLSNLSAKRNATPVVATLIIPTQAPALPVELIPNTGALEDTLTALYKKVNPGTVLIRVLTQQGEALGSGFVIDKQGHIVTNYHVVEGQTGLEIDFPSGIKVRGQLLGTDLDSDLAAIHVDVPADKLFPLPMGDSEQVKVGQSVVAIGNPFGLQGTMTMGIISATGRTLSSMHTSPSGLDFTDADIIQTDAAINPGNSGGPLVNLKGEVIAINRAIRTDNYSSSGEPLNSGVGFAVPINIVKRVIPSLVANGKYDYPYLGVSSFDEITLLVQEALGLPQSSGAYVSDVTPGSPAAKAGLIAGTRSTSIPGIKAGGDLIIAADNRVILAFADLISYLVEHKSPGDTITLTVLRAGTEVEVPVKLTRRP
ncbi:MAG: S1C family serine protease [Omnitrophica WOR_2 bacterium]